MKTVDPSFLVALSLTGKKCLLVGDSTEADFRAERLVQAGATLVRVAQARFRESDLDEVWLCVLADRDSELARKIGKACRERRIFHCAVDEPGENGFRHVAVARSGRVQIGISTDGSAPALAKRVREELERVMNDAHLDELVERLAELRERTPSSERSKVLGEAVQRLRFEGKLDPGS